ncbi:hypothetical protein F3Y22_tig00006753pilonHSYRG00133 [Hibiscus syriacus]|uniref:Uncharacterized protein n=1 Tax=Hibiscus syriacus TaxID=106335 RepID=A0A6A3CBF0_HIBSY|nr:hypothetical protein F3Y22_tig00006753pilonHSYRG00133 [Hibiscus syriacus]
MSNLPEAVAKENEATREVVRLPKGASLPVTLKHIINNISFAPIGLLDMFNSSGAMDQYEVQTSAEKSQFFDGEVSSELTSSLSNNWCPTTRISLESGVVGGSVLTHHTSVEVQHI